MVDKEKEDKANPHTRQFFIDKLTRQQNKKGSTELTEGLLSAAIQVLSNADEQLLKKDLDDIDLHMPLSFFKKPKEKAVTDKNLPIKKKSAMRRLVFPNPNSAPTIDDVIKRKCLTFLKRKKTASKPAPEPEPGPEPKPKPKPALGIVIHTETPKRFKEDEDSEYSKMKWALFSAPVTGNVKRLNQKMNNLIRRDYEIRGLETKIHAVLKERNQRNFKVGDEKKRSFFEYLKVFDRSDYDWDFLNAIKAIAADYGVKLTRLLVNFMLLTEEVMNKFRVLGATLKWIIEGENSIVIHRVVAVLDTVEAEIMRKKEAREQQKSAKGKGKAIMVEEEEPQGTGITGELVEDVSDTPILQFLNIILEMEVFWMHKRFAFAKKLDKEAFLSLEDEVDTFLVEMEVIESQVSEMKALSAFNFEGEDQDMEENLLFSNIDELWDQIEDSEFQ